MENIMSEETTTVEASTETTTKKTRKARTMTVKNARGGKLILNGKLLQIDEELTLDAKYLADKTKMNIVNRSVRFGLLKKV
jgi:hypothetical protein